MKTGGVGGAKTLTGLNFESKVDFQKLLGDIPGYSIVKIPGKAGVPAQNWLTGFNFRLGFILPKVII